MNNTNVIRFARIFTLFVVIAPQIASKALGAPPETVEEVKGKLCEIMGYIFTFALAVGVICILFAAFTYITSGGNSEKVGSANKAILYAVVGLVVAFLATSVPAVLGSILGSDDVSNCP